MKVFIPPAGTVLTLAKDWTFNLQLEGRNSGLIRALNINYADLPQYGAQTKPVTLPAGTRLVVKDYAIRKGGFSVDSRIGMIAGINGHPQRFWVRLDDANNIEAA